MSAKQRLVMSLASAGVPVDTVTITGDESANVTYMPWATEDQIAHGNVILSVFDWSAEAQAAWDREKVTAAARGIVLSGEDARTRATRAACLAIMLSLQEARAKINEIVAAVNSATGSTVDQLVTGSSFAEAMGDVVSLLDMGVV